MQSKKWTAGVADETWKVIICGRDLYLVANLLENLSYYLTDAGSDTTKGLALVRQMTGEQIVDALEAHKRSSLMSVQNGIQNKKGPPLDEPETGQGQGGKPAG